MVVGNCDCFLLITATSHQEGIKIMVEEVSDIEEKMRSLKSQGEWEGNGLEKYRITDC